MTNILMVHYCSSSLNSTGCASASADLDDTDEYADNGACATASSAVGVFQIWDDSNHSEAFFTRACWESSFSRADPASSIFDSHALWTTNIRTQVRWWIWGSRPSGAFSFHVMEQRLGWSFVYGGQSSSIAEIKHDHQCNGWKVTMNKQQSTLSKTCPGGAELEKNKHVSKSPQRKCGRMQMKTMKRLQILSLNLPWKPLMQPAGRTHRYTAGSGSGAWL